MLREWERQQPQPLRGRRGAVDLYFEAVLLEDVEMVDDDQLVRRRQLQLERRDEPLGVDLGRLLQRLKVELLVGGVLVNDE